MRVPHRSMPWMALALAFCLIGCGGKEARHEGHESEASGHDDHGHEEEAEEEHAAHAEAEEAEEEGHVLLSPAQRQAAGIALTPVVSREIPSVQELPGEVVVNADRLAHVVPRFSGIAHEIRKNLGDLVQAGDVLAVIEANESLARYEVKSLIGGTVIEKHITLGEFVSDEQDIYVIADLSSVWVNVTVYARDLERIRIGQTAIIEAAGISEKAQGKIDYVGPVVGEATRTSIARIVLSNPLRVWRPGLFVAAHVRTELVQAGVVVADKAIQTLRGQSVVFVEEGDGFRAQAVEVGLTHDGWTEIRSGLVLGDRVVGENSFILKSELLKNEAGHGHGH